jgi:hypothetical protein
VVTNPTRIIVPVYKEKVLLFVDQALLYHRYIVSSTHTGMCERNRLYDS